jgi:hypothetical protein
MTTNFSKLVSPELVVPFTQKWDLVTQHGQ